MSRRAPHRHVRARRFARQARSSARLPALPLRSARPDEPPTAPPECSAPRHPLASCSGRKLPPHHAPGHRANHPAPRARTALRERRLRGRSRCLARAAGRGAPQVEPFRRPTTIPLDPRPSRPAAKRSVSLPLGAEASWRLQTSHCGRMLRAAPGKLSGYQGLDGIQHLALLASGQPADIFEDLAGTARRTGPALFHGLIAEQFIGRDVKDRCQLQKLGRTKRRCAALPSRVGLLGNLKHLGDLALRESALLAQTAKALAEFGSFMFRGASTGHGASIRWFVLKSVNVLHEYRT